MQATPSQLLEILPWAPSPRLALSESGSPGPSSLASWEPTLLQCLQALHPASLGAALRPQSPLCEALLVTCRVDMPQG